MAVTRLVWTLVVGLAACNGATGPTPGDDDDDDDFNVVGPCTGHPGETLCDGATVVTCTDDGAIGTLAPCASGSEVCADGACVACDALVSVPGSDPVYVANGGLTVEIDAAASPDRFARLRTIEAIAASTLQLAAPFVAFDAETGAELHAGDGIAAGAKLLVGATSAGDGTLGFTGDGCASEQVVAVHTVDPAPIAVVALDDFPYVETWDLFTAGDTVAAYLDTTRYPDRDGVEADLYVVPHRTPQDWLDDRTLAPEAGPVTVTFGDDRPGVWNDLPVLPSPLTAYDLVVDFGRDGALDPGDLLDGLDAPAFQVSGRLSDPGPFTPHSFEVSQSYWVTMRVYYPEELDTLDPVPLVVISHGNGHDYTWYDYLGNHLASHGYVVIAHRNNTGPGPMSAVETTWENTQAFIDGLPLLAGGALDGHVDTHAIAWIGHSRGGEGVVIAYNGLVEGYVVPSNFTAADIQLVSSIAPTVFESPVRRVNPHDVPYHLIAGSLDGDVTGGVDNPITQYFRILQNAEGLHAVTYVQGADHNDFNCCGFNDAGWTQGGPGEEIGRQRAQQVAKSYYLALLEAVFHDEQVYWEFFARVPERFHPPDVSAVIASQLERAQADGVTVIDDFQANAEVDLSSSGGAVAADVRNLAEGILDDSNGELVTDADAFNGMSQSEGDKHAARGITFQWDAGDDGLSLEFALPADARDLTDDAFVAFRACQVTRHPNTTAAMEPLTFGLALVDGGGEVSEVPLGVYGGLTEPYGRNGLGAGTGWVNEFQSIRVPISAFVADGRTIDLHDVAAIRFLFGPSHGSPVGRIGFDDLVLLAPGGP